MAKHKYDGSRPGPGRPKGSKNKWGNLARENILEVFEQAGGVEAMVEWAKENRTEFYSRVYTRLLPLEAYVALDATPTDVRELTDAQLMALLTEASRPAPESTE